MTQALNLGLLGNNVNTSGQVSLTAGVAGTLPVGNGGTGATTLAANNVLLGNGTSAVQVVAPSTSGNVLQSNGSTWVSGGVPAPSTTNVLSATAGATFGAVGTYAAFMNASNTNTLAGNTIAGSSLRYDVSPLYGGGLGNTSGTLGFPAGGTAPSGTWRKMGGSALVSSGGCCSTTWLSGIFLRIS
jgi:hypothetical protein